MAAIGIAYSQSPDPQTPASRRTRDSDSVSTTVPDSSRPSGIDLLRGRRPLGQDSVTADSIPADTTRTRLSRINRSKVDIESTVTFNAKDSLVLSGLERAFLYGDGTVEYQDFKVNSAKIEMDLDSSTVHATGMPDSVGELTDTPVFQDKSGEYESKTMKYNFKTQRGYITEVITEQQDGYLTGGKAKRTEDGAFYVEDGKYTTCEDHEHPHFYFQLTKAKVRPKKDVVTGPGYMVLADVPLPLALPFGYFPFSEKYSSGIIFPTFGDDFNRGFYLRDGGYYFAINDNLDLALRGEIYTKGSWGLSGHLNYVKRYKFRGAFDISFLNTVTENTKSSTVNLTYRFPGTKWSLSATANITQRTQDSTLQVSFPNINVTMSQTAPFKRKRAAGAERWYEKIKLSYSGQFQNSLTSGQDEFFKKSLIKDWRNGMKHYVPVSATFSLFKYLNVSPSISLNDRMYTSKIRRQWDTQASREVQDTTYGFYNIFDFNLSMGFDTKVYGFWKPMKFLGDKVEMIRHVLTPTVSFNWQPDFGMPGWGIYDHYTYIDAQGHEQRRDYSFFNHGIFGVPGRGRQGAVSVNLANNLEMKVKSDKDSTGVRKISLIENLSLSQSYNFAADSLRLSPLQLNVMLRIVKNFNLNFNTTWDPYSYRLNETGTPVQVDRYCWQDGRFLQLSSFGTSFSYTFNNDTFRRKKDNGEDRRRNNDTDGEDDDEPTEHESFADMASEKRRRRRGEDSGTSDADGYAKWNFPWSVSVNYSVSYGYGDFNYEKMRWNGRWNQNLSINGNVRPTKNWNFSFSASYDFQAHKIAYMNCSISRDLHCFTMSASFVPVGPYKSYNFHIAVKSSLLKDLKYDQRSQTNNGVQWY